jgi:hypothetical protein
VIELKLPAVQQHTVAQRSGPWHHSKAVRHDSSMIQYEEVERIAKTSSLSLSKSVECLLLATSTRYDWNVTVVGRRSRVVLS